MCFCRIPLYKRQDDCRLLLGTKRMEHLLTRASVAEPCRRDSIFEDILRAADMASGRNKSGRLKPHGTIGKRNMRNPRLSIPFIHDLYRRRRLLEPRGNHTTPPMPANSMARMIRAESPTSPTCLWKSDTSASHSPAAAHDNHAGKRPVNIITHLPIYI